jgi:hypothetical protein
MFQTVLFKNDLKASHYAANDVSLLNGSFFFYFFFFYYQYYESIKYDRRMNRTRFIKKIYIQVFL